MHHFIRIPVCLSPFHCFLPFSLSPFHKTFSLSFFVSTIFYLETLFSHFLYLLICLSSCQLGSTFHIVSHRICTGTEERFEEEGMAERNYHELAIISSSCTTWFLAEETIRALATVRGESKRLGWRTEDETVKREWTGEDLMIVFLFPTTHI